MMVVVRPFAWRAVVALWSWKVLLDEEPSRRCGRAGSLVKHVCAQELNALTRYLSPYKADYEHESLPAVWILT